MTDYSELIAHAGKIVADGLGGTVSNDGPAHLATRSSARLAGRIDHTLLKPGATAQNIESLCREAGEHGFASVCVNSRWVSAAAELLADHDVMVCTVVGFPLGAMASRAKAEEARVAVSEGADEVDMVLDLGALLSGSLDDVHRDIRAVVTAAAPAPVKVIIETALLDDEQKAVACLLAAQAGAAYVKTSTGFNGGGATVADIALMRAAVGDRLGVKASGGVRTAEDAAAMLAAGADRIGASASVAIVAGSSGSGDGY